MVNVIVGNLAVFLLNSFKDVIQWGDVEWATCFEMFNNVDFGVDVLTATDTPNTTNVTDFSYMFAQTGNLNIAPELDVSSALTVTRMFYLSDIEQVPFYNTINCQDFGYMFRGSKLTSAGYGGLDTSSAIEMDNMFYDCDLLTSVLLILLKILEECLLITGESLIVEH